MESNKIYKYQKYCNEVLNVKLFCKPIASNTILIGVETNGIIDIGKIEYNTKPKPNEPKYWDKINEIYKQYYLLNIDKK